MSDEKRTSEPSKRLFIRTYHLLSNIIGPSYKLAAIDNLFTSFGADPSWRTKEGPLLWESDKKNRVRQWLEGINRYRPDLTYPIVLEVLNVLVRSDSTITAADRRLAANLIHDIEQALNLKPPPAPAVSADPRVVAAMGDLYAKGEYADAVRRALVALITAVQEKAGTPQYEGEDLMNKVFSPKNPILQYSSESAVQEGCMSLFKGAVAIVRNPLSHSVTINLDAAEANELLWFASFLFRTLDRTTKIGT